MKNFDYDLKGCMKEYFVEHPEIPAKKENQTPKKEKQEVLYIVVTDKATASKSTKNLVKETEGVKEKRKGHRKRVPMSVKLCSLCPVRYRFVSKLQEHMKQAHNVDLFVCKVSL